MPPVSQLMDEFDTCTKGNPTVNNQKDVILCDLMMELNERKCIYFFKLHVLSYPFLSYVNRCSVEENETMSKCFAVHASIMQA